MASLTIRNLSPESEERLRLRAERRGCTLEALARSILDGAADAMVTSKRFPYYLIEKIAPGEDIEPFIQSLDEPHTPIDLK